MNLILLDADVIIDLHRLGAWDKLIADRNVLIPSIIAEEAYYFEDENLERRPIDLQSQIADGAVNKVAVSAAELAAFTQRFDPVFQGELHAGEKEALFILEDNQDMDLCTCDKAAIKALALLGIGDRGVCVESLLRQAGLTKPLEHKHTKTYFDRWLDEGQVMRIQGQGLKASLASKRQTPN